MYWFHDGSALIIAKQLKQDEIELLTWEANQVIRIDQEARYVSFLNKWDSYVKNRLVFQDVPAFRRLSKPDQTKLALEFLHQVTHEKQRLITHWHKELKPWVIRLQEIAIERFGLSGFSIDPESTRVMHHGKMGTFHDFRIKISRSFYVGIDAAGCEVEHDTSYPCVFAITDNQQGYSMYRHYPEQTSKQIRIMQEKHPRKFKEFLTVYRIEEAIWAQWFQEMGLAGITYEAIYQKT